ncbi:RagB/SusD family nutrient uptake outer membrane protein [Bacteroidales bacterium OttesenSCG-928-M06]|nr:RagB/SusD family nutrient uptake outer membrane protein [Bacteroidales bacterium OttesenSCG-928-M06]
MKVITKISLLASVLFAVGACADLDTIPEGQYVTQNQKEETIEAFPERIAADIAGMYSCIGKQYLIFGLADPRDDDHGYPAIAMSQDLNGPDMVGDNTGYNWFSLSSDYADRSTTYANPLMRYAIPYYQMRAANSILADISADTKNETLLYYRAQAKAVRAFDYLSLAPYYQFKYKGNEDKPSVPIVASEIESDYSNNPRVTQKDLYKFIIDDLTQAIEGLEGYVRNSKTEIDQQVAYGLRARAYLYMEKWEEAAADAAMALDGYNFYSRDEISKPMFISLDETSWMWGIEITPAMIQSAYPSWPSVLSSFSGESYSAGVGCYKAINSLLYRLIPSTDVRKGWWVDENLHSDNLATVKWVNNATGEITTGDDVAKLAISDVKVPFVPYTNVKFGQYGGIGSTVNAGDWCLMRAEEMLFIQAEALAMAGDLPGGKLLLEDFVKTYRDPNYTSRATTQKAFQDEVWFQRRVELWGEGFSMSDIMRLGKPVVRVKNGVSSNFSEDWQFNIAADDPWLLLRFPQKETNNNRGIVQNTGGSQPKANDGVGLKDGVTD